MITTTTSWAALAILARAASAEEIIWSSTAFVLHGDRTPLVTSAANPALTPLGGQQLFSQGSAFGRRYVRNDSASPDGYIGVHAISQDVLINSQVPILAVPNQHITGSALAFMQGLYPPSIANESLPEEIGGAMAATLANGSTLNFPLDGYQYPDIQAPSRYDPNHIWIDGIQGCDEYDQSVTNFPADTSTEQTYKDTLSFYEGLSAKVFAPVFSPDKTNYHNAYELYDYASYQMTHNSSFRNVLSDTDFNRLRELASSQQRDLYGNLTVSGNAKGDMIRAVSGRTLLAKVASLFNDNINNVGTAHKLNVLFGSHEPLLALFELADLRKAPSGVVFDLLPEPGSAIVFELFSPSSDSETQYPLKANLWVRFLYRPATSPTFTSYPLFGRGNSQVDIPYNTFTKLVSTVALSSVNDWCTVCSSSAVFCSSPANQSTTTSPAGAGSGKITLTPTLAGVVGAIVALVVASAAVLMTMVLGGVRFSRVNRNNDNNSPQQQLQRSSTLGGFKGAEKMASDADLAATTGTGARHARTGSWEMSSGKSEPVGASIATEQIVTPSGGGGQERVVSSIRNDGPDDTDVDARSIVSEMGVAPTRPRESI